MLEYDEPELHDRLERLSPTAQARFALAAALRQLRVFELAPPDFAAAVPDEVRNLAARLERALDAGDAAADATPWMLETIMTLLPDEDEDWEPEEILADHAVTSLAYAVRCVIHRVAQEAAWSARRAYEAADQVATWLLDIDTATPESERRVLAHAIVQRELAAQAADLQRLADGAATSAPDRPALLTRAELTELLRKV